MPTLRDIARLAGVSVAAASYALRGDRRVGATTAARIREAAKRLSYRRDPLQAAHAGGRFRGRADALPVAFISHMPHRGSPDIAQLIRRLPERGYLLRPFPAESIADVDDFAARLQQEGIRLLVCAARDPRLAILARGMRASVFWQVEDLHDPPGDVVLEAQWSTCVWEALRRMRAVGYERIGVAIPSAEPPHWQDDETRAAVTEAERRMPGLHLVPGLFRPAQALRRALPGWVRRYRPQAMLCLTCMEPDALRMAGIDLPCALLHSNRFHRDYRGLAGFCVDWGRMLTATVELLDLRLRQREHDGARITLVQPRWMDGPSLPHLV
jgi:LacI family transcriptional regulator